MEYVGVRFYLPENDDLLESSSMFIANKTDRDREVTAAHMPLGIGALEGKNTKFVLAMIARK